MQFINKIFLIKNITFFRVRKFFAYNFIRLIKRFDDLSANIVFEKLQFFIFDFFLKFILNEIYTYVLFFNF